MPSSEPSPEPEAKFERELAADSLLRQRIDVGSWIISLSAVAVLLVLTLLLGRTSPWLVLLTLYGIFTRLGAFVASKAFLYPRFLERLDDADPATAAAARVVFDRHRARIAKPILVSQLERHDDAAITALTHERLARLARDYGIDARRRFGCGYFLLWSLVSVAVWTTLLVTCGGPTG